MINLGLGLDNFRFIKKIIRAFTVDTITTKIDSTTITSDKTIY